MWQYAKFSTFNHKTSMKRWSIEVEIGFQRRTRLKLFMQLVYLLEYLVLLSPQSIQILRGFEDSGNVWRRHRFCRVSCITFGYLEQNGQNRYFFVEIVWISDSQENFPYFLEKISLCRFILTRLHQTLGTGTSKSSPIPVEPSPNPTL